MTLLEQFNICNRHADYNDTKHKVSWKIIGDTLYFEPSHGAEDWWRNIMIVPVPYLLKGRLVFLPIGILLSWLEVQKATRQYDGKIKLVIGYSLGAMLAGLYSAKHDVDALTFGNPRYVIAPFGCNLFQRVTNYLTPWDVVSFIPPGYTRPGTDIIMLGEVSMPHGLTVAEWCSGHHQSIYRQYLAQLM